MAIHSDHPGLEVEVIVNGKALKEYDDDEKEAKKGTVVKYIEAQEGENYSVKVHLPANLFKTYSIRAEIYIDGISVCDVVYSQKKYYLKGYTGELDTTYDSIEGMPMGQRFRFAKLKTGKCRDQSQLSLSHQSHLDEASGPIDSDIQRLLKATGSISVHLHRVIASTRLRRTQGHSLKIPSYKAVPEKMTKGSSMSSKTE
ncbi:hypothetical protein J1614_004104 [Plenodomus biglobosus]|nr:hypothetical protein J1614_004104 [Plenodomus biglobosus]